MSFGTDDPEILRMIPEQLSTIKNSIPNQLFDVDGSLSPNLILFRTFFQYLYNLSIYIFQGLFQLKYFLWTSFVELFDYFDVSIWWPISFVIFFVLYIFLRSRIKSHILSYYSNFVVKYLEE